MVTAVLVVLLPVAVWAAALDDYYLARFGLQPAGTMAAAGVAMTGATIEPERCKTWLYHDLKRDWKQLLPETRKTLAKVLPARPALASEGVALSNGGHFHIHYAASGTDAPPLTDANGNGIPDWVESVADVFEAVYSREVVVMGFRPPPTNGNQPYDIYLQNVGSDPTKREFGETDSDLFVSAISATSYIIIDNDFSAAEFGNQIAAYTPLKALQITAAHEFHHAIQYGYNFFFEAWYAEATSTWMEDEVYDSVNQLYNYLPQYFQNTALPLNTAVDVTTGGGYGRWIFNRYLAEVSAAPPYLVVRKIWEDFATKSSSGPDIPMLPVIDEVLKSNGSSLDAAFLGLSRRFFLSNWASHLNETGIIHALVILPADIFSVTNSFDASTLSLPLPAYAFKYLQFLSSPSSTALLISYPNKPANFAALAFLQSGGGGVTEYGFASGAISIPSFVAGDAAYLLVCNNVTGATAVPVEPTQAVVTMADATNPNIGPVTLVTAPVPPPAAPSGGGGGGCFIATAAYGSYLHPKVKILRDFRDVWLLTNAPGRAFVRLYYRLSPPIAAAVSRHASLRLAVRCVLAPIVWSVENKGAAVLLGVCLGGVVLLRRRPLGLAG